MHKYYDHKADPNLIAYVCTYLLVCIHVCIKQLVNKTVGKLHISPTTSTLPPKSPSLMGEIISNFHLCIPLCVLATPRDSFFTNTESQLKVTNMKKKKKMIFKHSTEVNVKTSLAFAITYPKKIKAECKILNSYKKNILDRNTFCFRSCVRYIWGSAEKFIG